MKHTKEDGLAACCFLIENGFEDAQLIGSLAKNESSEHDIDILLPKNSLEDEDKLMEILLCGGLFERTDWGGIFFHGTQFGNVDIFFTTEDFDY